MLKLTNNIQEFHVDHLKVGVISDSQLTPQIWMKETVFERNLTKCLESLKANGCNMIIFAGDITNKGAREGYRRYMKCFKKVFGDDMPILQHIMGNHDYYFGILASKEHYRKIFEEELGQNAFTHYVVNGYHFIGASPTSGSMTNGYVGLEEWLEDNIKIAINDDANKPIFVTTHNSPKNTTYGSDDWGDILLGSIFEKYPNIVTFAGHTHYSMMDERCFYNDKYIAISTQAVAYTEMEHGKKNGTIPPLAYTCPMGYIIDFDEKIIVHRYDLINNKEMKADSTWQIYPRVMGTKEITKPIFEEKECRAMMVDGVTHLIFTRAVNNDIIHSYKLVIDDSVEQLYFSDFYLGDVKDKEHMTLPLFDIAKGCHDIKIYAINSNNEESDDYIEIDNVYIDKKKHYRKIQTPDKINYRF